MNDLLFVRASLISRYYFILNCLDGGLVFKNPISVENRTTYWYQNDEKGHHVQESNVSSILASDFVVIAKIGKFGPFIINVQDMASQGRKSLGAQSRIEHEN